MIDSRLGHPLLTRRAVRPRAPKRFKVGSRSALSGASCSPDALATAITLDASLAEEVVQDAFAGLHRRFQDVENPVGYLQRSVVNASIKVLRRRRTAALHRPDRPPVTHIPEIDETWEAVTRLPARQRAVVALRYWEDLSEAEIADSLGWPTGTVKSTLHRALKRLKKEITS